MTHPYPQPRQVSVVNGHTVMVRTDPIWGGQKFYVSGVDGDYTAQSAAEQAAAKLPAPAKTA
jgi:hypothetical protein